jgi:hypothetical protein
MNNLHQRQIAMNSIDLHCVAMSTQATADIRQEPSLLGVQTALEIVFPDASSRPSLRTWNEWRAKGFYPYIKIGKRVFIDPVAAIKAIEKRFTVESL